jgi:anti-sigma B factor antagonist
VIFEDKQLGNYLIVKYMQSRLDAHVANIFKKRFYEYIENGSKQIVLDLAAVDFIDSSGLGAIVSCLKHMGEEGTISICCLRREIQTMFSLTRMDRVFEIYDSINEATGSAAA